MIVIGLGCRRAVTPDALLAAAEAAMARLSAGMRPDCIATAAFKRGEPAFDILAEQLGLPLEWVEPVTLEQASAGIGVTSTAALLHLGVPSVAEASALAVAGDGARLIVPRATLGPVTYAIAQGAVT